MTQGSHFFQDISVMAILHGDGGTSDRVAMFGGAS